MGARAYKLIERANLKETHIVVEVGADRGEGSTPYLRSYCKERGIDFISIDIDPERTEADVIGDGLLWLGTNDRKIDFAYLDNYDYIYEEIQGQPWVVDQVNRYRELGLKLHNEASKKAHLNQTLLIHRWSVLGSLIVFDDTWADRAGYHGKGGYAVPWLLQHGWRVELAYGEKWDGFFALRRMK